MMVSTITASKTEQNKKDMQSSLVRGARGSIWNVVPIVKKNYSNAEKDSDYQLY